MPTELHTTQQSSRNEVIGCLMTALFFLVIGIVAHHACLADNPVYHDASILKKLLMAVVIDGAFIFFALFCIYGAIYSYYHRLIFDENGITEYGIWLVKTIRISEMTAIQWDLNRERIKLRTLATRITFGFEIFPRNDERLKTLIVFLRESVPFDRQKNWKRFCHRMEKSKRWKDKKDQNAIPVPDPEKGEILYTRKMFNRTIPLMIFGSVILWSSFGYLVHLINQKGYTIADLPGGIVSGFIFIFCGLWIGWVFVRLIIPKNGQVCVKKHLLGDYYSGCVVVLIFSSFPISCFFCAGASKSDDYWGKLLIMAINVIPFLPLCWMEYQKRKDINQTIESLPDDYMPKIFEKNIS